MYHIRTSVKLGLSYIKERPQTGGIVEQGAEKGGKIEKNEMRGACGAYGGGERCAQGSGGET